MSQLLRLVLPLLGCFLMAPAVALALDPGEKAPPIEGITLDDKRVTAEALRGKVVIVDFWASWCAPCKQELPVLQALANKYARDGLVVVGVSVDSEQGKAAELYRSLKLSLPSLHDRDHTLAKRFSPPRMPSSYLIDRKGIVRHVHAGFRAGDERVIEQQVRALLGLPAR